MKRIALLFLLFCSSANAVITEEQLKQKLNGSGEYADFFSNEIANIVADDSNLDTEIIDDTRRLIKINDKGFEVLSNMLATTILYLNNNESVANDFIQSDIFTEKYENRKNAFQGTQYEQLNADYKKNLAVSVHALFVSVLVLVCKYAFSNSKIGSGQFMSVVGELVQYNQQTYKNYIKTCVPVLKVVCQKLQSSLSLLDDSKKHPVLVDLCDNYENYIKEASFENLKQNALLNYKKEQEEKEARKEQQFSRKIGYVVGTGAVLTVACGVQHFREKDKPTSKRWFVGGVVSGSATLAYVLWQVLNN